MLRKNKPNMALLLSIMLISLLLPAVSAAAGIVIDDINVDDRDADSDYDVYCREDSIIQIKFHDVGDYERWDLRLENVSGTEIRSGEFDGSSETLSFTTEEVRQLQENNSQSFHDGKDVYSYDVILRVVSSSSKLRLEPEPQHSAKDAAFYTDGDYYYDDGYTDGDYDDDYDYNDNDADEDDEVETEGSLTHTITVHVDMDPPAAPELNKDVVAGEEALTVSWTPVTYSESGNREGGTLRYTFCVRKVDGGDFDTESASDTSADAKIVLADTLSADGDADLEAELSDSEPEQLESGMEDEVESELSETVESDGDTEFEAEADAELEPDSEAEPDVEEEAAKEEDGDEETGEELYGCINPEPEGVTGDSHRIGGLTNGVMYEIRARTIDAAGNYSFDWSDPVYGTPQMVDDFWETYKRNGGDEKGGFCFIATAAYGAYDHQDVVRLRAFRDMYLAKTDAGRKFIELYYRYSPPAAKVIEENGFLRWLARVFLFPIVLWLKLLFEVGMAAKFGLLGGVLATAFFGAYLPSRRNG